MASSTLQVSSSMSKYCRASQRPSGSSLSRLRKSVSDWSTSAAQAWSTGAAPYLSISATIRSRATLLAAIIDERSSATISGARTMLSSVSMMSRRMVPPSTSLMPGELKPSVKMSRESGLKPPGTMAPMS